MGVQPDQSAYDGPPPASSNHKRKRKRELAADHSSNVNPAAASDTKKKAKIPKESSTADPAGEKRLRRSVLLLHPAPCS